MKARYESRKHEGVSNEVLEYENNHHEPELETSNPVL